MDSSTLGKVFRLSIFGESHGPAIGALIEGCPAGLLIDRDFIRQQMQRRRPAQSEISSPRQEEDEVEILSGLFEGRSNGAPICLLIRNKDARPEAYDSLKDVFRPSHADFTYLAKYGLRDHRGSGRASARETAARVAAGAIAQMLLRQQGIGIHAWVSSVQDVELTKSYSEIDFSQIESNAVRCPDAETAARMLERIRQAKEAGDSVGGTISAVVQHCPAGWGEPVFDKLQADLAKALFSIHTVKGLEFGSGFAAAAMLGSEHNDAILSADGKTASNHAGGIVGGISNGMDIPFRMAFKPVSSIAKEQDSINTKGEKIRLSVKGRHDPCVLPRAVPIVEAMTAVVLADHMLRQRLSKWENE